MFDIRLSPEETEMLRKILESYLSDLRVEIGGTEVKDLREELKKEEGFIKELLHRLQVEEVHAK